ncbi:conserved exported hypothetical protein [Candidatus Sulfopaludibacter sp. SbA4]|nr:conserved exported hypothetical protein [Candidatus Sulfopaludibacter sp. SbA4]
MKNKLTHAAKMRLPAPGPSARRPYNIGMVLPRLCAALLLAAPALAIDLKSAVIVAPATLASPEKKAAAMLADEIEKRTRVRLPVAATFSGTGPAILLGPPPARFANRLAPAVPGADGYRVQTIDGVVVVAGNDPRGTLFGAGALLRNLRMERDRLEAPDDLRIATAPKYPLRGHQLGYRPKTNSYDGWSVPVWEQYMRDLAVFGTNAIELIPPRSDDDADSPHFPLPPMQMMVEMSRLADSYGLDVWIWYPAMDRDYSDPKTVEFALQEWGEVFRQLPRIDAIFVPGGDPGHTEPKYLMALLEKETAVLHRYHPKAQLWVSPQSFNREWMDQFLGILKNQQPAWLSGVVFGPQVRMSLPQLRAAVPQRYPIRHYPDITHSRQSQYPVPDWDVAYAVTEAREVINPRPMDEANIFRLLQPHTIGFLTYSEGCNDDVNKMVWSALGWNPDANVVDILHDYARYFIGERYADSFAQGLLALERNWRGPLATNAGVYTTLEQFQKMESGASPQTLANWRFQQALYRAYYDAYTRSRLLYESGLEDQAMLELRNARALGASAAMNRAEEILDRAATDRTAAAWRARIFELAEALFQSIRMQLSVPRYKAISVDRGANLDTVDMPLNNRLWLKQKFADLRAATDEPERLKEIDNLVNWTDPGPGGFYDDLGNLTQQPHLVRGPGAEKDPAFLESSLVGFAGRPTIRTSWWTHAESLVDAPLQMRYEGLDRDAQYRIRVVYAGDSPRGKIRLVANDSVEIHPLIDKPTPVKPVEFDIPKQATATGALRLSWYREANLGGNGRGCQVAEVWLIRK